jgi:hypothetical protein
MKKIIYLLLISLVFFMFGCNAQRNKFVTIGTGSITGVYYPTGGAISRMINNKADEYQIKATVESTGGSVYNINAVLNGDLEFGIAQSDRQHQAYNGTAEWNDKGKQSDLRSVFSIHPEAITLISLADSNIKNIHDLKNKKVNLGNPGSGQLQNAKEVLSAFNVNEKELKPEYVKAVESAGLLQDKRIDAFFYTVGHPNGSIKEASSGRNKIFIVPITGQFIETLLNKYSYYAEAIIPKKFYPLATNIDDVKTIGVKATLITSAEVDDDIVYALTKEVFENLEEFKTLHPAYYVLSKKNMLEGLSAPIHKGALRYYTEAGLVEHINPKLIKG